MNIFFITTKNEFLYPQQFWYREKSWIEQPRNQTLSLKAPNCRIAKLIRALAAICAEFSIETFSAGSGTLNPM